MSYLVVDSRPFTSAGYLSRLIGKDLKSKKESGWLLPTAVPLLHRWVYPVKPVIFVPCSVQYWLRLVNTFILQQYTQHFLYHVDWPVGMKCPGEHLLYFSKFSYLSFNVYRNRILLWRSGG